jgi:Zn-dependent peptidase ImmA (M78 family)
VPVLALQGCDGCSLAWYKDERRNRAFAAEFLAPAHALKERFVDRAVTTEEIDEVAAARAAA